MGLLKTWYKYRHPGVADEKIPRWYKISLWDGVRKMFRKWMSAVVIPTVPFNGLRVALYRFIGYKIGGGDFYRYALLSR